MFRAAADDSDTVSLNGGTSYAIGGFTSFSGPFTVSNGFNAGVNTITFDVANTGGGPSGARLEFLSSLVAAVPEPATWAMMLMGFGMVGFGLRTRRNTKVATRVTYA